MATTPEDNMKSSRLKRTLPGIALLIGAMAGTALAMVPGAKGVEENDPQAASRFICSRSCKPCSTQMECGQDEGSCGVWRCTQ
jgi:hypothetical protein